MKQCRLTRDWVAVLLLALCGLLSAASNAQSSNPLPDYVIEEFGDAPEVPLGSISPALQFAARVAFIDSTVLGTWGKNQALALAAIGNSGDPRFAWIISDMLRFFAANAPQDLLARTASELLGKTFESQQAWHSVTNHLLAWDIPAPPDYLDYKRAIFNANIPGWDKLFVEGSIDWRLVSWGGVLIDNRPYNETDRGCNCIPAADNPDVVSAVDAAWLKDDDIVFGISVNRESRAYPRRIMEVREMVNDTLGGRSLGIPYCTLCGAAQAYFTDEPSDDATPLVLRTSGLLSRSNKVMYDLGTNSIFDTFTGRAVTGPLLEQGIKLEQTAVVTTDWATWKRNHPETTVLLERYALGRNPDFRNGRDANGPIFPVGAIDPRLPAHEEMIGVITSSGKPVAFQRASALIVLNRGDKIEFENVRLKLDAGGITAVSDEESGLSSHEAFWFAWSQFHPDTELWLP